MTRDEAIATIRSLRRRGYDQCKGRRSRGEYVVRVGCSQCNVAVICGLACHETGCPRSRRAARR